MYYLKYFKKISLLLGLFIFLQVKTNEDILLLKPNRSLSTINRQKLAVSLSASLVVPIAYQYYKKIRKELPSKVVEQLRSEGFSYSFKQVKPSINEKKIQNNNISLENKLIFNKGYSFFKILFCWNPKFFSKILEWLNPIFFLGECTTPYCPYTRKNQSPEKSHESREDYENRVTKEVVAKLTEQESVEYVSFGSGGMLQDFIIIQKILEQKPEGHLSLHFIDLQYEPFLELVEEGLEKLKEKSAPRVSNEIARIIPSTMLPAGLGDLIYHCLVINCKRKQFINCLKKQFPKAQIQLNLYGNFKKYIEYLQNNNDNNPDILTTIDIDFGDWGQFAVADYTVLLSFIKKNSPETSIVSLLRPKLSKFVSNVVAKTIDGPYNEERITKEYWSTLNAYSNQ